MSEFHIDEDDLPVGRVLSRRDAVRLLAAGGVAIVAGCRPASRAATADSAGRIAAMASAGGGAAVGVLPNCVARPQLTIGPYFVDRQLERSDIRGEPSNNSMVDGVPLALAFRVQQIGDGQCSPLAGAMVDVWQCDAIGQYSAVNDTMVGFDTRTRKFLRGYQVTDASGLAKFVTIYPGWYQGRTVHIHFMIRTPAQAALADQTAYEFTSQLFFDDDLTDRVHARAPYAAKGQRTLRNDRDGIFRQSGGDSLLLRVTEGGGGYESTFDIGLDLSDASVGASDRMQRGPGRRPPPGERRPPG